jgi:hypothetical protein
VIRALVITLLAIAGCGGPAIDGPPAVELGTGLEAFQPLHDGDPITINMGPQGGYHLWAATRAANLAMDGIALRYTLTRADDAAAPIVRNDHVDLTPIASNRGEHLGSAIFLNQPADVRGQPCLLRLTATDADGRTAAAELTVTPE